MPEGNPLPYAVEAEANLEKLATTLAQLGADEATVDGITQMAEVVRQIVTALGEGQPDTGDDEAPAPAASAENPSSIGGATDQLAAEAQRNYAR